MLVLTRSAGEKIVIDGDIVVTVVSVDGGRVRLGITAPASVRIDRDEVHGRRMNELAKRKNVRSFDSVLVG